MKAVVRVAIAALMAGLALGPVPALAQDAPASNTSNSAAPDTIGPRELQNFDLQGRVTRQAQPQEAPAPAPARPAPRQSPPPTATQPAPTNDNAARTSTSTPDVTDRAATEPSRSAARSATQSIDQPRALPVSDAPSGAGSSALTVPLPPVIQAPPAEDTPHRSLPLLPWLLAFALAGGLAFLYWRNRQRAAFAGGPGFDAYVAPPAAAPEPQPAPTPVPRPAPRPDLPVGLVSTRLRPWLDLGFRPLNCVVDNDNVVIEFELELFNSGNSPAREILVEASYFNAGPDQEQRIEQFYRHPVAEGGRAASLAPLKRMVIRNRIVTPRDQVQEYEVEGRKLFVPLIGFNALYRWGSGEGQTSASFMLGRKTGGEKMAPLRLDMGERQFHALGDQPLPVALRQ